MNYSVKEIFYTLQGEGANVGRPAVFCRFAGCNLWSGREANRATAVCTFCDTDFVGTDGPGGGKFATPNELAGAIASRWPPRSKQSPIRRPATSSQCGPECLEFAALKLSSSLRPNGICSPDPLVPFATLPRHAGPRHLCLPKTRDSRIRRIRGL